MWYLRALARGCIAAFICFSSIATAVFGEQVRASVGLSADGIVPLLLLGAAAIYTMLVGTNVASRRTEVLGGYARAYADVVIGGALFSGSVALLYGLIEQPLRTLMTEPGAFLSVTSVAFACVAFVPLPFIILGTSK